jgi:hypothetical protein
VIKRYLEYLKDNPKGYWFRAKWFGWGWTPATWQGWLVIIVYIGIVTTPGILMADRIETGEEFSKLFLPLLIVSTAVLLWICYLKGEKPRWSWGPPKKK